MSQESMSKTENPGDVPLDQQVQSLSRMIDNLQRRVVDLEDQRDEYREELNAVRDRLDEEREAREQLERTLEQRTSLLARADELDNWDNNKYAAYVVQKLVAICHEDGLNRKWVDASTAWEWLNRQPDRTSMYDIFRKAESLTDGPIQYIEEERGSNPPSRLELDLSVGDAPTSVGQHPITVCGDSTTREHGVGVEQPGSTAEKGNR